MKKGCGDTAPSEARKTRVPTAQPQRGGQPRPRALSEPPSSTGRGKGTIFWPWWEVGWALPFQCPSCILSSIDQCPEYEEVCLEKALGQLRDPGPQGGMCGVSAINWDFRSEDMSVYTHQSSSCTLRFMRCIVYTSKKNKSIK